mmetsp:Transcript_71091/g.230824  ORF Transcript_71091/g.230824 Transcript_71091/m.230824 type:complete len:371 (+) Transcript_71091:45-1157(+)
MATGSLGYASAQRAGEPAAEAFAGSAAAEGSQEGSAGDSTEGPQGPRRSRARISKLQEGRRGSTGRSASIQADESACRSSKMAGASCCTTLTMLPSAARTMTFKCFFRDCLHTVRPDRHDKRPPHQLHNGRAHDRHAEAALLHVAAWHRRRQLHTHGRRRRRPLRPPAEHVAEAEGELVELAVPQLANLTLCKGRISGRQLHHGKRVPLVAARSVAHLVLAQRHSARLRRLPGPNQPRENGAVRGHTQCDAQAGEALACPAAAAGDAPHLRAELLADQRQGPPDRGVREARGLRLRGPSAQPELADLRSQVAHQHQVPVELLHLHVPLRDRGPSATSLDGGNPRPPLAHLQHEGLPASVVDTEALGCILW